MELLNIWWLSLVFCSVALPVSIGVSGTILIKVLNKLDKLYSNAQKHEHEIVSFQKAKRAFAASIVVVVFLTTAMCSVLMFMAGVGLGLLYAHYDWFPAK